MSPLLVPLVALSFWGTSMAIATEKTLAQINLDRFRLSGSEVYYNGAVAAEHPQCSEIGVKLLEAGGSAMDAAIGGLLCVGVLNNFSSGIGGGGFMLVRDAKGNPIVIDFRETAAATAHRDMFNQNITLATDSTLSTGVPGEIRGFAMAHAKYGRLPWAKLFEPSIKLAKDGFFVSLKMEQMIEKFASRLMKSPSMVETYFRRDGTPKKMGDIVKRPRLAWTLQKIAKHGPDTFYNGEIGEHLIQTIQENEGGITMEDMRKYQAITRPALIGEFAGFKVITSGLPTCGPLILQILNVLQQLNFTGGANDWASAQKVIETFKFAYVDRMKMGDPAFIPDPDGIVARIVSAERASQIAPRIHANQTFPPKYYLGDAEFSHVESHGTTHLTAMDRDGMVVSATSTVNLEWGCKKMCPVTGIILNNEVDDFSIPVANNSFGLPPSSANFIFGGKRPLSSAAPVILERDGKVLLALGGAGGSRIITSVAEMIIKLVLYGMDPDQAMNSCRLHHQLIPDAILAEDRCDRQLLRKLNSLGHTMIIMGRDQYAACINMIVGQDDGGMIPVSDPRKGGVAAGF